MYSFDISLVSDCVLFVVMEFKVQELIFAVFMVQERMENFTVFMTNALNWKKISNEDIQ